MARTSRRPRRPWFEQSAQTTVVSGAVADTNPSWVGSALVALAALALYLTYLPPVSGEGDSSEFTLVLALDGVAHPTGYPLYTLLGHGFVQILHALGVGWAPAAGAWSAACSKILGDSLASARWMAEARRRPVVSDRLRAKARSLGLRYW
jgi:hypothetical protein